MSEIKNIPNPEQIRKEISDFLKEKYGDKISLPPHTDKAGEHPIDKMPNGSEKPKINFNLKPSELEAFLKEYVIDQDEAIEVLATKICTHFNRMKLEINRDNFGEIVGNIKSNVLMIGPTGVGKTYAIKLIAKKIGVPFVKGDATKFSETGYVGGDVDDLVRELVHEAKGDVKLAEYGIIYLDEIDKIASSGYTIGPDVSRTGVQRCLIKLMEESEVDLKTPHDLAAQMEAAMEAQRTGKVTRKKINTKNILFVMSGAFSGLPDIIKRRLNKQPIGFRSQEINEQNFDNNVKVLKLVRSEDLINFGFESEFVGRLPVIVSLNDLDVNSLYNILKNPNNTVILGKKRDFAAYNISLDFEDDALMEIAKQSYKEHTGARGLLSVIDRILLKFEKMLPDTNISELKVTKILIDEPLKELSKILDNYYIERFKKNFYEQNAIKINFTDGAIRYLTEQGKIQDKNLDLLCCELLGDYGYGLRLLKCKSFTINEEIAKNPKGQLEELIKHTYEY